MANRLSSPLNCWTLLSNHVWVLAKTQLSLEKSFSKGFAFFFEVKMSSNYSTPTCANANANLFNSRYHVASPCQSSSFIFHSSSQQPPTRPCASHVYEITGKLRPISNILYLRVAKQTSEMAEMKYERSGWQPRWRSSRNPSKNTIFQAVITFCPANEETIKAATSRKKRKSTTCVRQLKVLELHPDSPLLGLPFGWSCLTTRRSTSL